MCGLWELVGVSSTFVLDRVNNNVRYSLDFGSVLETTVALSLRTVESSLHAWKNIPLTLKKNSLLMKLTFYL
jgi:hypothetical protein